MPKLEEQKFTYKPLLKPSEIRILQLLPAAHRDEIVCCRILHSSLTADSPAQNNDIESFEALSYTWGSHDLTEAISCEDDSGGAFELLVTPNLESALRTLRLASKSRSLWIDQICINQNDAVERSSQVQIMADIYKHAKQAVIWLGEGNDESSAAIDFLKLWVRIFTERESRGVLEQLSMADLGKKGLPKASDPRWRYLAEIFTRPWFRRVWIIQEAVFAPGAVVFCGEISFFWNIIVAFVLGLARTTPLENHLQHASDLAPRGLATVARILTFQTHIDASTKANVPSFPTQNRDISVNATSVLTLSIVLGITRQQLATDARDKIYAILGFLPEKLRITPDYSTSINQVFRDAAKSAIRNGDMYLLQCVDLEDMNRPLPSWVPDWAADPDGMPEPIFCRDRAFTASGESEPVLEWCADEDGIKMRVLFVDELNDASKFVLYPSSENPWYSSYSERWTGDMGFFFGSAWKIGMECLPPLSSRECRERLWRTMIGDCNAQGYRAGKDFGRLFMNLFRDLKWHWIIDNSYYKWMINPILIVEFLSLLSRRRHHRDDITTFLRALEPLGGYRAFVLTRERRIGWVSKHCQVGDRVVIIHGCSVPFMVRETEDGWKLVGDCYMDGLMDGVHFESYKHESRDIRIC